MHTGNIERGKWGISSCSSISYNFDVLNSTRKGIISYFNGQGTQWRKGLRLQPIYKPILILAIILKKKDVFLQTGILSFANYGENLFYWKNLTQTAVYSTETEEVCWRKCRLRSICFIQEPLGWNFFMRTLRNKESAILRMSH